MGGSMGGWTDGPYYLWMDALLYWWICNKMFFKLFRSSSLAWPDRYFFYRAFIAFSISARRKIAVWLRETIEAPQWNYSRGFESDSTACLSSSWELVSTLPFLSLSTSNLYVTMKLWSKEKTWCWATVLQARSVRLLYITWAFCWNEQTLLILVTDHYYE